MSKVKPRTKLVAIHPVHGYAIPPPQDVKVSRRNARERNRVKTVNNGFEMLKRHIPSAAPVKKMSKVNILNQAVEYIESLQCLLTEGPSSSNQESKTPSYPPQLQHSNSFNSMYEKSNSHHLTPSNYGSPSAPSPHCYPSSYHTPGPSPAPPLTPISPNTMYYPHYSRTAYPESGYDSHGDTEAHDKKWHHQDYHQHHQQNHQRLSPMSPASSNHSPNPHYLLPLNSKSCKTHPVKQHEHHKHHEEQNDSSGEEDDILDAIAEWQHA